MEQASGSSHDTCAEEIAQAARPVNKLVLSRAVADFFLFVANVNKSKTFHNGDKVQMGELC